MEHLVLVSTGRAVSAPRRPRLTVLPGGRAAEPEAELPPAEHAGARLARLSSRLLCHTLETLQRKADAGPCAPSRPQLWRLTEGERSAHEQVLAVLERRHPEATDRALEELFARDPGALLGAYVSVVLEVVRGHAGGSRAAAV